MLQGKGGELCPECGRRGKIGKSVSDVKTRVPRNASEKIKGHLVDADGPPIPGLYAVGERVGGMFYFNYPGGGG